MEYIVDKFTIEFTGKNVKDSEFESLERCINSLSNSSDNPRKGLIELARWFYRLGESRMVKIYKPNKDGELKEVKFKF